MEAIDKLKVIDTKIALLKAQREFLLLEIEKKKPKVHQKVIKKHVKQWLPYKD
jgi:hypothetical protein